MKVTKKNGELVDFDVEKFSSSLRSSGTADSVIEKIVKNIQANIYDGISTHELYKKAFDELKSISRSSAARYSLKKALLGLGPAGYAFEEWVARVFRFLGYRTETEQLIRGHAVTHEADVIAQKGNRTFWVECKFRNDEDTRISVTTPMYVLSRIKDISGIRYRLFDSETEFTDGWLITNSYFTTDSIDFSEYYGLKLLSWDYPKNHSIKNLVDDNSLYPVTCLTTLTQEEIHLLLGHKCLLVSELVDNPDFLSLLQLSEERKIPVLQEAGELLKSRISE